MGINLKTDYSYLFSNMNNRSNSGYGLGNMNFLSDYYSIKNGSYGKLLKAYFTKVGNDSTTTSKTESEDDSSKLSTSLSQDSAKTLTAIDKSADKLKASADKLINNGENSVFAQKEVTTKNEDGTTTTTQEYDMDAIYGAVSDFVNNYNALLDDVNNSSATSVQKATSNMTNITNLYSNTLKGVGITIGTDNKLTLDEETFKAADMSKIKSVFNESPSFTRSISSQASFIDNAASSEALKANTYTDAGSYSNNYSIGNMFDSLF